jgi:uncharacterized protein (TIRG00374 family)
MNRQLRSIIKYSVFFGLGIFLVWWQFHKMTPAGFRKFKYVLENTHYILILPVILMALASHLSRAIRWRILIEPLGYKPSLFNVFSSLMAGYLVNSFVTRVGEVVKCTLLARYEKIPTEKLLGTVVFERIFDLLCYFIFIGITILIQFQLVGEFVRTNITDFIKSNKGTILMIKAASILVIVVILFFIARGLLRKYSNSAVMIRARNFIEGLKEGIAAVKRMKQRRWFLFHTFFIWSMYLLQIYVGFLAMKEVSHLGIDAACSVLTLATIAMIIMPGGLGAFPKAVSWVLLLYSIEEPIGEAFGFLMWGTTTFIILFFGLIFTGLMIYLNKRNKVKSIV